MHHAPCFIESFSRATAPSSFGPSTVNAPTTVRPEPVEGFFTAGHAKRNCSGPKPRRLQRGIAALEFALLAFFVMVPLFLGVFVFWEVLQTQQVLTRATGDVARQVSRTLNHPDNARLLSDAEVRTSISSALRGHLGSDVDSRLTVELSGSGPVTLNVIYQRPALLGSAGGLNFIEPETLHARSFIQ